MFRNRLWHFCDENTDGNQGGAGGGGDGGEGGKGGGDDNKAQIELLTKSVGLLAQGLEELRGTNTKLLETVASMKPADPPAPKPKTIQEEIGEMGDQLEEMDNKTLVETIVGKLTAKFEDRIKELSGTVDQKVGSLAQQFHGKTTAEEVQKMIEKNADFMEWAGEMKQILREHPNMSVSRAYTLAKEENPTKKAEMTKKYAKAPTDAKPKSYGLTPTSSRTQGTGKMSPQEAAEKAFDEIMSGLSIEDERLA